MTIIEDIFPAENGDTSLVKIENNFNNLNSGKVEISDYTAADVKSKYESNADTNAYTDAEQAKVANTPADTNATLALKEDIANKGIANGYAELDGTGKVPAAQLPVEAVTSVNGETGVVVLTTGDIAEDTDKNYVTDAEQVVIGNTSGTNTGDQDLSPYSLKAGDTYTGNHDFGGASKLEIPNGVAPTINTDGEIAIDTSISGLAHGIIRYFAGEEVFNLPLPVAQLAALNNGFIPKFNSATQEFELLAESGGTGDTITTTVNTIKKDSTDGTSDTYGVLTGVVDGANTLYTVSTAIYVSSTLTVYRNGTRQVQGTGQDWVETTPASGTFTFNTAPTAGDVIDVEYSNQDVTSSSLIIEKAVQTKTGNYTALSTDGIVYVNAASGDVTITLPAISGVDRVGIDICKIDSSGNTVTIATPGSETISNEATQVITTPFQTRTIKTDGINYFII